MKRKISLCMALVLLLTSLCACGGNETTDTVSTDTALVTEQQETEEMTQDIVSTDGVTDVSGTENVTEEITTVSTTEAVTKPVETEKEEEEKPVENKAEKIQLKFNKYDLCLANDTGRTFESTGWFSTDYINVDNYYAISYTLAAHKNAYAVSFYDANKQFISGTAKGEGVNRNTFLTTHGNVVVPEGAVYARFITYLLSNTPMRDASVTGYTTKTVYNTYLASKPLAGLKIAMLGDSITEGDYGLQKGVANVRYRNYPFFLAQKTGAYTVNYGDCGATASSYLNNMYNGGQVNVADADVVVFMLGANFGLKDENATAYDTLVKKIQADMKSGATLVIVTPPHATDDPTKVNYGYLPNIIQAGDFIRDYAQKNNIILIDSYNESPIQADKEDIYQKHDGLHLCEEGYEVYADFIAGKLLKILGKQ